MHISVCACLECRNQSSRVSHKLPDPSTGGSRARAPPPSLDFRKQSRLLCVLKGLPVLVWAYGLTHSIRPARHGDTPAAPKRRVGGSV